jgi:hypothetical protein
VTLRSGGGSIRVKRLFGLDVQLDSDTGPVTMGALYGTKAANTTGGGALALAHACCSGLLAVDSEGGSVQVEGLEGAASLLSGGGPIQVGVLAALLGVPQFSVISAWCHRQSPIPQGVNLAAAGSTAAW